MFPSQKTIDDKDMSVEPNGNKLDWLRNSAIEQARHSEALPDIEKAATITKAVAESRKAETDAANQRNIMYFEQLKSWAAVVVPLLTLLTLAVTVWMQYGQLSASREANRDLQWRETVKLVLAQVASKQPLAPPNTSSSSPQTGHGAMPPGPAGVPFGPAPAGEGQEDPEMGLTLLKSFIHDPKYANDALDLGLLLACRTPPSDILKDFYSSAGIELDWDNVNTVIGVDRKLKTVITGVFDLLPSNGNGETPLEQNYDAFNDDARFLGNEIAQVLRTSRPPGFRLDLGRTLFFRVDLTDGLLAGANLTDAIFDRTNLRNADLSGVEHFENSNWYGTAWWEAKEISPKLLLFLIKDWDPKNDFPYDSPPPARDVYIQKIEHLCGSAKADCPKPFPYDWHPVQSQ